jgi:hypothetical protein
MMMIMMMMMMMSIHFRIQHGQFTFFSVIPKGLKHITNTGSRHENTNTIAKLKIKIHTTIICL